MKVASRDVGGAAATDRTTPAPADAVRPDGAARVVLVGRTGLDAALRTDRGVQLARARGAIDAVGELADITDEADPRPGCVIVGPGAVEGGREGALVSALRRIDPRVRVLATGAAPEAGAHYDGAVPPTLAPAALRSLVRGVVEIPAPAPAPTQPARPNPDLASGEAAVAQRAAAAPAPAAHTNGAAPKPTPPAPTIPATPAPAATPAPIADDAPLAAILAGRDPAVPATDAISSRLGVFCTFTPADPLHADAPAEPGTHAVVHAGRTLGRLHAPGVPRERAEAEAAWLAGWVALAQQQDQLRRAAFTDELTGAWNRRYFHRFLGAAIDQARAARHPVTLLYFDIDNFKTYNDRYGHAAGDEILVQAVKLLSSVIRPSDRVCRIGGDEFGVVFHDPEGPRAPGAQGPASIAQIAARFQRQICEHRFPKLAGEAPGTLTISGGMATFPWDGASVQELLDRADQLALQSKRQGKNVITFGPGALRVCGAE
jgi:diguanylate cyclase (GGDEF)-like protein